MGQVIDFSSCRGQLLVLLRCLRSSTALSVLGDDAPPPVMLRNEVLRRHVSPPRREDDREGHYMFSFGDNLTPRCKFQISISPVVVSSRNTLTEYEWLSHVLGAYACFLWEIEEEEGDCGWNDHTQIEGDKGLVEVKEKEPISPAGVGGNVADSDTGENIEDYYKRMVEGNPGNPFSEKLCSVPLSGRPSGGWGILLACNTSGSS